MLRLLKGSNQEYKSNYLEERKLVDQKKQQQQKQHSCRMNIPLYISCV